MGLQGKNGLKRNAMKFSEHWEIFKEDMEPYLRAFIKKPSSHNWVDLFVESGRTPKGRQANYLMGHVWAVYFPLSVITIGILTGLLLA